MQSTPKGIQTGEPKAEAAKNRTARTKLASEKGNWRSIWFGMILAAVTVAAYVPAALHGGFVWDDDKYVTANRLLTAPDGLRRIWFSFDSPSQYFPLVYTTFRVEHALWGLNPSGYHWVNILLHVVNALLVWRLLVRLSVPGAWLAAAIFSLHPVQVESVAWVTELKNVLMGCFFLLTLLSWLAFVDERSERRWLFYGLALCLYALALSAKTTACTLPAALLLILWLKRERIDWKRLLQLVPFILLGVGMGLLTIWWERFHQGTLGPLFALSPMERTLVASRAIWFYLSKLFWPSSLTFIYPRWTIRPTHFLEYRWLMALAALGVMIYLVRRYVGRGVEVAAAFFVLTLSPVLGFIMLYTFRYTFVADHYQYLASIGPIALAAAGTATLAATWKGSRRLILGSAVCVVGILAALTWHQTKIYDNLETLWRDTLAKNPAAWMAHNNLGALLARQGKLTEAIEQYERALQVKPDFTEVYNNLGNTLAEQGKLPEAVQCYKRAIELKPSYAEAYYNLGNVLAHQGKLLEAIQHYERAVKLKPDYAEACYNMGVALRAEGKVIEAIQQFEQAIQLQSDYVEALNNLAYVLATSQNALLRNTTRAIALSEQANHLTGGGNPIVLGTLATAYAEAGRYREALETVTRAVQLPATKSNLALISAFESQLKLYRAQASSLAQ